MEQTLFATEQISQKVLAISATIGTPEELMELEGYTQVAGHLTIRAAGIQDLSPLRHLKVIVGSLSIVGCHGLTDLKGLDNLKYVGEGLIISNNSNLQELTGIRNLRHAGSNLILVGNPKLV